jgi:hypothetical protein
LPALSLYCDLALKLLDTHYFDRFKELSEYLISRDDSKVLPVFLLFKRISSSTETEYSEKLLDLTELVLARLNKKITEMSGDELKLCTICISIVSDLLEVNQILEHQMTTTIMSKKYSHLFKSLEEITK